MAKGCACEGYRYSSRDGSGYLALLPFKLVFAPSYITGDLPTCYPLIYNLLLISRLSTAVEDGLSLTSPYFPTPSVLPSLPRIPAVASVWRSRQRRERAGVGGRGANGALGRRGSQRDMRAIAFHGDQESQAAQIRERKRRKRGETKRSGDPRLPRRSLPLSVRERKRRRRRREG